MRHAIAAALFLLLMIPTANASRDASDQFAPISVSAPKAAKHLKVVRHKAVRHQRHARQAHRGSRRAHAGISISHAPAPLVAKVQEIATACSGMHPISGFRRGARIAGTNKASLHASGRAIDIAGGSYACAYRHLAGWAGGYSIDPGRVHHIHISYAPGSREFGARFAHGGHRHRYAHRKHRYARA